MGVDSALGVFIGDGMGVIDGVWGGMAGAAGLGSFRKGMNSIAPKVESVLAS